MDEWEQKYLTERQAHKELAQQSADITSRLCLKISRLYL